MCCCEIKLNYKKITLVLSSFFRIGKFYSLDSINVDELIDRLRWQTDCGP